MNSAIRTALRNIPSTRKPIVWADVKAVVSRDRLPKDLPAIDAAAIDGELNIHLAECPQFFLVDVAGSTYLVNTEGYDYVRYATKVVEPRAATAAGDALYKEKRDEFIESVARQVADVIEREADRLVLACGLTEAQATEIIEAACEFALLHRD